MASGERIEASEVLSLFPSFVWKTQWSAALRERLEASILESLRAIEPKLARLSAGESWQSIPTLHTRPELCELTSSLLDAGRAVLAFLHVGDVRLEVTGCWANANARSTGHPMHTHPNNFLSGVYYVQTWPGANTINFHDPRPQASVLRPPVTALARYNTDQVVVRVTNGTLLLFPSYLPHSVTSSESDRIRISVSFNLMFPEYGERSSAPMWTGE